MDISVHELIEAHVSKFLSEIFSTPDQSDPLAAVVVFDDIARRFRFSGFTKSFKDVLSLDKVKELDSVGMEMEKGGLISYGISRIKKSPDPAVSEEIWAYALNLADKTVFEANLTPSSFSDKDWTLIPAGKSKAGTQLVQFTEIVASHYGSDRAKINYLNIIPFSALGSSKGLVLIVWIEDDLSLQNRTKILEFLKSQGLFLSLYQISMTSEAERGSIAGYRRLTRLIEHEENGYLRTFGTIIKRLEILQKNNKLDEFKIDKEYINLLKDRLRSKKQLSLEMSNFDSLNRIPKDLLYNKDTDLIQIIPEIVNNADKALRTSKLKTITYHFGEKVTETPVIRLDHYVLDRIIRNAIKNSSKRCERGRKVSVDINLDICVVGGRNFLHLTIDDDAGGLKGKFCIIPRILTPQIWSHFCAERPEIIGPNEGVGLWMISRYAHSLDGTFTLSDIPDSKGSVKGIRYDLLLALEN